MKKLLCLVVSLLLICPPVFALGYEKERKMSDEIITLLDSQGVIIKDADISWMLQDLTDQIAARIKDPEYIIKIRVVADMSVNAFAITDGNIFINVGTVLFAKDMDEIASVIAHEMGHCQLRHIPEAMKEQSKITAASVAGVIAGLLLSGSQPAIGSALVMSSLGGSQNMQLQYSRKHELEADEFGRNIMIAAGMDPTAITRFLVRMRTMDDATAIPQYFLTHPYMQDRIAAIQAAPNAPHPDDRFWTLQAMVMGELLGEAKIKSRSASLPEPYARMAQGLAAVRKLKYEEALRLLEGVENPLAKAYKGLALYHLGKKEQALPLLQGHQRNAEISLALAEILTSQGQDEQAIAMLKPIETEHPRAAYLLGALYEKKGDAARSHAAYAHYFQLMHNFKACQFHIDKALEVKDIDQDLAEELRNMRKGAAKLQGGPGGV